MKIAHLIVRDQLSVCRFFASKVEFENEKKAQEKETTKDKRKTNKRTSNKKATSTFDEDEYDEIFEETPSREIFFEEDDDRESNELNQSMDS